jgi:hypothetical protein
MQVQGKDVIHGARYSSPLDCAVKTLESEGVSSTGLLFFSTTVKTEFHYRSNEITESIRFEPLRSYHV